MTQGERLVGRHAKRLAARSVAVVDRGRPLAAARVGEAPGAGEGIELGDRGRSPGVDRWGDPPDRDVEAPRRRQLGRPVVGRHGREGRRSHNVRDPPELAGGRADRGQGRSTRRELVGDGLARVGVASTACQIEHHVRPFIDRQRRALDEDRGAICDRERAARRGLRPADAIDRDHDRERPEILVGFRAEHGIGRARLGDHRAERGRAVPPGDRGRQVGRERLGVRVGEDGHLADERIGRGWQGRREGGRQRRVGDRRLGHGRGREPGLRVGDRDRHDAVAETVVDLRGRHEIAAGRASRDGLDRALGRGAVAPVDRGREVRGRERHARRERRHGLVNRRTLIGRQVHALRRERLDVDREIHGVDQRRVRALKHLGTDVDRADEPRRGGHGHDVVGELSGPVRRVVHDRRGDRERVALGVDRRERRDRHAGPGGRAVLGVKDRAIVGGIGERRGDDGPRRLAAVAVVGRDGQSGRSSRRRLDHEHGVGRVLDDLRRGQNNPLGGGVEPVKHVEPAHELAEDRVLEVQVTRLRHGHEILRAVGVLARVGHRKLAAPGELRVGVELVAIFEIQQAPRAGSGRVASLDHEPGHDPVERRAVELSARGQRAHDLGGVGRKFGKEPEGQVAESRIAELQERPAGQHPGVDDRVIAAVHGVGQRVAVGIGGRERDEPRLERRKRQAGRPRVHRDGVQDRRGHQGPPLQPLDPRRQTISSADPLHRSPPRESNRWRPLLAASS